MPHKCGLVYRYNPRMGVRRKAGLVAIYSALMRVIDKIAMPVLPRNPDSMMPPMPNRRADMNVSEPVRPEYFRPDDAKTQKDPYAY